MTTGWANHQTAAKRRQHLAAGVSPQTQRMGSFTQLSYHIVFATKFRRRLITSQIQKRLYEYIGGTLRAKKGSAIEIGGVEDHVHILARLSPTIAVSEVIRDVKACSSKWLNEEIRIDCGFKWQKGYGAFTVSYDRINTVRSYIRNQAEHHKTKTLQEEYVDFLTRHKIEFRMEHLFEDEHHG